MSRSSRIAGFYKHSVDARVELLKRHGALGEESAAWLHSGGGLPTAVGDRMSENVVASYGLPFSIGLNFLVNGQDVLVPMVVEEPSVVAAASNAAKMVRGGGGFHGEFGRQVMTAQVQFDAVPNAAQAPERVQAEQQRLIELANAAIPSMVARGGGCLDIETRVLDEQEGVVVVHLHVEVGDAMGANLVDTVAEALAEPLQQLLGGQIGLRILTNLPLRRLVKVSCFVRDEDLGGAHVAEGIAHASRFAELDVFRAVTHNKGFMNGLDAAAVALGQDWRSLEAGAHAYAAFGGKYRPISTWRRVEGGLRGECELPIAVGTVGGSTRAHAGVRAAFELLGLRKAGELAVVLASVGLASNLAALRALSTDGIQKGHMKLHQRKAEAEKPAQPEPLAAREQAPAISVHPAHKSTRDLNALGGEAVSAQ